MIPDAETLLSGLEQSTHSDGGLRVSDGSDEILRQIKYLPKKRSRGNGNENDANVHDASGSSSSSSNGYNGLVGK